MANKDFVVKNGLIVGGNQIVTSSGALTSALAATTQSAADNSTKVATTAYVTTAVANLVDSSPSTLNTLNELAAALGDDANYATTTTNALAAKLPLAGGTLTGNIDLGDNVRARFGANPDLQIFHNGTDSLVQDTGAGSLMLAGSAVFITNSDTSETMIRGVADGAVTLYHNNVAKLDTTSGGVSITDNSKTVLIAPNSSDTIYYDQANLGIRANTLVNLMPGGNTRLSVADGGTTITGTLGVTGATTFTNAVNVIQADDSYLRIEEADGTDIVYLGDHTGGGKGAMWLYDHGGTPTVKLTADSHANYINNGNSFGIGTTSPNAPLEVSVSGDGSKLRLNQNGVGGWDFFIGNTPTLTGVGAGALEIKPTVGNSYLAVGLAGTTTPLIHITNTGIHTIPGSAANPSYTFNDDKDIGMFRATTDTLGFATAGAERFRLTSVGNALLSGGNNNEVYMDIFSDSGSNRGAGYFRFLTDGASAQQSVAQIYMEQGSGDGASRKSNMYFQVADNGAPTTAMTIENNKNVSTAANLNVATSTVQSSAKLTVNGGIRFNHFSAGHGLNCVSNQTFNNTNTANNCGNVYYKTFILNFYHNNGHTQALFLANGGGGVGFPFTVINAGEATIRHGNMGSGFSLTTVGSSPNTFSIAIGYGNGQLEVERTSGSGSFGVQVMVLAGG